MNDKFNFHAEREIFSNRIAIRVAIFHPDGMVSVARSVIFDRKEQDGAFIEPCMTIPWDAAQSLIDELWHAGLRPSQGIGSAGQIQATERHLADMKQIAFHALKISSKG